MVQQLPLLQTFELAMPGSIYNLWRVREKGEPYGADYFRAAEPERIWRRLSSASEDQLPLNALRGYWIYLGLSDVDMPFPCFSP